MCRIFLLPLLLIPSFSFLPAQEPIEEDKIMALNTEMMAFLDKEIKPIANETARLKKLVFWIFDKDFLSLEYEKAKTKTAAETFNTRNGNCLSFTLMFVALAREAGLNARFQEVHTLPKFERQGQSIVLNRHMNTQVFIDNSPYTIDFNPFGAQDDRWTRLISDRRAIAQYYNNNGAEYYGNGQEELALAYFNRALEIEPGLSYGWTNMGVVFSHQDRFQEAEDAYKHAIRVNRHDYTAMGNLVRLFERQERLDDAKRYMARAEAYWKQNPYYHFSLGLKAERFGNFEEAIVHFRRAVRKKANEHDFYAALARVYEEVGDFPALIESLQKARDYAPDVFNRDRYIEKIETVTGGQLRVNWD